MSHFSSTWLKYRHMPTGQSLFERRVQEWPKRRHLLCCRIYLLRALKLVKRISNTIQSRLIIYVPCVIRQFVTVIYRKGSYKVDQS